MGKFKKVESTGNKYPAQKFSGKFEYCNVFPADKKLKVPVDYIKFDYPWTEIVHVRHCTTWGELFKKIYFHFRKFYAKDWKENAEAAEAWHCLEDYIVEGVDILHLHGPGGDMGIALVEIGS